MCEWKVGIGRVKTQTNGVAILGVGQTSSSSAGGFLQSVARLPPGINTIPPAISIHTSSFCLHVHILHKTRVAAADRRAHKPGHHHFFRSLMQVIWEITLIRFPAFVCRRKAYRRRLPPISTLVISRTLPFVTSGKRGHNFNYISWVLWGFSPFFWISNIIKKNFSC